MKKLFIITLLAIIGTVAAMAQKNLDIGPFFEKEMISQKGVSMISYFDWEIEGHTVKAYKSITIADNKALADKVRTAVGRDGAKAEIKETSFKDGQLYFGFYSLGGKRDSQQYVLYLNRRPIGEEKTTLIYIEGDVDSRFVRNMLKLK